MLFKFLGYRSRRRYWSGSKFSIWLMTTFCQAIDPSKSRTSKDWKKYGQQAQAANPFVYWLANDFLDYAQDIAYFPSDVMYAINCYYSNRFKHKIWCLNTKLPKGEYHEIETRIIHGLFETLVDFIEIEKASMMTWTDEGKAKYKFSRGRCAQAGIDYLTWEMALVWDDQFADGSVVVGQPTHQAISAREQFDLYNWWKTIRPARVDPYEREDITHAERRKIEDEYDREDEEMMIRLIKLRRSLWT